MYLWVLMEFCSEGTPTKNIKGTNGLADIHERDAWIGHLASGLKAMHDLHVIHRDIKPGARNAASH